MKRYLLIASTMLALPLATFAQDGTAPVPEFKNKVYLLSANNALSDLEGADLQSEMKTGMTTAKINFRTSGKASSVKTSGQPSEHYVVKLDDGVDPETAVELFEFQTDKKSRYFLVGTVAMGSMSTPNLAKHKLSFSKLQPGVYVISAKEPLQEGEYAFVVNRPSVGMGGSANVKAYAFEVGK